MDLLGIILCSVQVASRLAALVVMIRGWWKRNHFLLEKSSLLLAIVRVPAARDNSVAAELLLSEETRSNVMLLHKARVIMSGWHAPALVFLMLCMEAFEVLLRWFIRVLHRDPLV